MEVSSRDYILIKTVPQSMGRNKNLAQLAFPFDGMSPAGPPPGPPPAAVDRHTLFFAILPDGDCAARADRLGADLRREHGLKEKPRPPSLLHMTLCCMGPISRLPHDAIALALRAGGRSGGAAFTMNLDEVFSFKQAKHPIVLCAAGGNDAFRMLHIRLALALRNSGLKVPIDRSLQPHMTLAYNGKDIAKTRLAAPISLKASAFVLIRSHHGEGRHEHLGQWPLGS